jgi:hypothetical protein
MQNGGGVLPDLILEAGEPNLFSYLQFVQLPS